jgi:hypothetical protein
MKDILVLNRVWNKTSQQFFLLKHKVDWNGCSRLLREKSGKGDPTGAKRRGPTARGKRVPGVEIDVPCFTNLNEN